MNSRTLHLILACLASLLLTRCSSSDGGFEPPSTDPKVNECSETGDSSCGDPCTENPDSEDCKEDPKDPEVTAKSCKELYEDDNTLKDGDHKILINDTEVTVYCDMTNGGWTGITSSIAEEHLSGTANLIAGKTKHVSLDTSSGSSDQLCAYGKKGFTYRYAFNVPFGYTQFYLSEYQIKANGQTKKSSKDKKTTTSTTTTTSPKTSSSTQTNTCTNADCMSTKSTTLSKKDSTKRYKSEIVGKKFQQTEWAVAYSKKKGGTGDVSFGSPTNSGPTTSFATENEENQQCEDCELSWPKGSTQYTVSTSEQSTFQIEWGEYSKKQVEGWCAWHSGTIFFY